MATITGTIRSAGEGMPGLRILAYEEVRIGIDDPPKPCRSSHPTIKKVGETTTDSTGSFRISFTPTEPFEDACSFSAGEQDRVVDEEPFLISA